MTRIQILGIGCKKSRALKANLLEALARTGMDAAVEDVREIDRIISYQILSTPALLIDGELFYQGVVPEVEELERLLRNFPGKHTYPKTILAPTDFSAAAANAFHFALALAQEWEAKLHVLHVYHPAFDQDNPLQAWDHPELRQLKENKVSQFVAQTGGAPVTTIPFTSTSVRVGYPAAEIIAQSNRHSLIVMGTGAEKSPLEKVFGSVATQVAREARCPVLLVPPAARFRHFRKILIAANRQDPNPAFLSRLIDLLDKPSAELFSVHVELKEGSTYRISATRDEQLDRPPGSPLAIKSVTVLDDDVLDGLVQFAVESEADLVVMGARDQQFFTRLFNPSLTRRMIFRLPAPLLVLQT